MVWDNFTIQNVYNSKLLRNRYIRQLTEIEQKELLNILKNKSKNIQNKYEMENFIKKYQPIMNDSTYKDLKEKHRNQIDKMVKNNDDFKKLNKYEQYVELQRLVNLIEKSKENQVNVNLTLVRQPRQLRTNKVEKRINTTALFKLIQNNDNIKKQLSKLKSNNGVSNEIMMNRITNMIHKKHKHVFLKYELNKGEFRNKNGVLRDLRNIIELEKNKVTNPDNILNVFFIRHCYSCANKMKKGGILDKYFRRHFISPMCTSIGLRNSFKTGLMVRKNHKQWFNSQDGIFKIYSSPLPRALLTAYAFTEEFYDDGLRRKVLVDTCVSESVNKIDTYKRTGSTGNSVTLEEYKKWTDLINTVSGNRINFKFNKTNKGENKLPMNKLHADMNKKMNIEQFMRDVIEPCTKEIKKMHHKGGEKTIIIVSHQNFINSILKSEFGHKDKTIIPNNGIVHVQFNNNKAIQNSVKKYEKHITKNTNFNHKIQKNYNKEEQKIKNMLHISKSGENALCNHNIKSKTIQRAGWSGINTLSNNKTRRPGMS